MKRIIKEMRLLRRRQAINSKKAVMIGCGFVGSASVFALMQSGLFTEIVLIDADKDKAEGEAMDISHGIPFASPMKIYAGDYDDVVDAAIVIISAGAGQKPGETRLDLVNKNVAIFKSIIPEIAKRNFAGIMLGSRESGRYSYSGSHKVIRTSGKQSYWFGYCVR